MNLGCVRNNLRLIQHCRKVQPTRCFTVLALESSADDTCAAVVTSAREILANVVIKQNELHEPDGGINPGKAILAHQRNMPYAVQRALDEARVDVNDVDGIAFTRGPGMLGCLSVGMNAAKTLAAALDKPVVGVHHMQAHALISLLTSPISQLPQFPFLTLLVSGGHTLLVLSHSLTSFRVLATTSDESVGQCIDKISRMLALKWTPLGPGAALEQFCAESPEEVIPDVLVHPSVMQGQLAFSYSGLHSQVERYISLRGGVQNLDTPTRRSIGRSFQKAAFVQLEEKLKLALKWCDRKDIHIKHLVIGGGVASNTLLRTRLETLLSKVDSEEPISLVTPPPALCTDNAVMIGWASMHRFLANDHDPYSVEPIAKWSLEDLETTTHHRVAP